MDIFEKLKAIDKRELSQAVKKAQEFAKTDEGRAMIEKIKKGEGGIDKEAQEKLLQELGKNPDIAKKLSDLLKG